MTTLAADDGFRSFGPTHLLLLVLFAIGVVVVVRWGRGHRDTEERDRRVLGVVLLCVTIPLQIYQFTPTDWDLETSLPIALCDLAWMAAAIALLTRAWWAVAFTYYVGLSITIQGVLTPSLDQNFPDPRFFGFWAMHFLVVWSAVYLTWGLGIRPTWRSYWFAVGATAGWAVSAYLFNIIAGTNYGYLNHKPSSASVLDFLGPWPWYVFAEIAIVFVGWLVVMTLPWVRASAKDEAEPQMMAPGR